MPEQREIEVKFDQALDLPGTWRLTTGCADEETQMIMMGGFLQMMGAPAEDDPGFHAWKDDFVLKSSPGAIQEHLERCESCQKWQKSHA